MANAPHAHGFHIANVLDFLARVNVEDLTDVKKSTAKGQPFFTNGHLGVDLLYVPPNESFPLHVHPGHHLLYCVRGRGSVTFDGKVHPTKPGDLYMIEGGVEHAVGASSDGHWILSFGAPHKAIDSDERMTVVEHGH